MRILIVEDEHKIANAIKRGLEQHSYAVDVAYNGDDGASMAMSEPYDLFILDRMLPGDIDGLGIVKQIRTENIQTPILMLTAKSRVLDKAEGLNAGADDYLAKPFAFVELIARVRALLRRPQQTIDTTLIYDNLTLDLQAMQAARAQKPIDLTSKEYALLEYFMRNPDRIVTKDQIIQHVWNYDADILPNTVEVYVGYLRSKIDKPFSSSATLLHTKRGFGYYFGVQQ
ncbi:response regulator transcription factor [Candidatus Saccharibacteria bacterium]|nr:response regulator transcription factor [Candidatus Saccharibacteria bacterium]MCB9817132.1 response regulator transcription factor [Candidatus Nomurabacteria bacterium]HPD98640.1 response regulator transcription factor [Candidatus Saccharibacteria bacterium]